MHSALPLIDLDPITLFTPHRPTPDRLRQL